MLRTNVTNVVCQICKIEMQQRDVMPAELVRQSVLNEILKAHPTWDSRGYICLKDLNHFRNLHLSNLLAQEREEVVSLEHVVLNALEEQKLVTSNIEAKFETKTTFGERLADGVAKFGGSWTFIMTFWALLIIWIVINSAVLLSRAFDPYPFILLNLILSCLAALQAPVIMMSQNRQEAKDRLRGEHDYQINLKAEIEIRSLNEKMDGLLSHQWRRLMEIQELQMDLLQDVINTRK